MCRKDLFVPLQLFLIKGWHFLCFSLLVYTIIMKTCLLSKSLVTSMKGVAILLVMVSHVGNDGYHLKFLIPLGAIAVAVFLVLSGHDLMESYQKNGLSSFWQKRFLSRKSRNITIQRKCIDIQHVTINKYNHIFGIIG